MKIALINPAELEMSPYLRTYMEYLDQLHVDYDLIEWRRDLSRTDKRDNIISFNYPSTISKKVIFKLFDYWKYARFVEKAVKKNKYDRLVIFEYQAVLFLKRFLLRNYKNRYIIDVRDFSNILKYIQGIITPVDLNAYARVISSPGYTEWTVPVKNEIVCHNTTIRRLDMAQTIVETPFKNPLVILTNGILRTFSMDSKVVEAFKGTGVVFRFSGKGKDSELYKALEQSQDNVEYTGYYEREDEISLAQSASFINIFLADCDNYNTAMSNRFYLSLIAGVPMIVNSQNVQSKFVNEYHLGVVASSPEEIPLRITDYIEQFNIDEYNQGRKKMIQKIRKDIEDFDSLLKYFCDK